MKHKPLMTMLDTSLIHIGFVDVYRKLTLSERTSLILWATISVIFFITVGLEMVSNVSINIVSTSANASSLGSLLWFMFVILGYVVALFWGGWVTIKNILLLVVRGQQRVIKEYFLRTQEYLSVDEELYISFIKHNLSKRAP